MSDVIGSFRITLKLHSFQRDPLEITQALGITPTAAFRKDQVVGPVIAKRSFWLSKLSEGIGNEAFGNSLEDFLTFVERQKDFIHSLVAEGAEITVVLAQTVEIDDGAIFQLKLEPFFLQECGLHNIGLEVEAWTSEADFVRKTQSELSETAMSVATETIN